MPARVPYSCVIDDTGIETTLCTHLLALSTGPYIEGGIVTCESKEEASDEKTVEIFHNAHQCLFPSCIRFGAAL
jgi:hypothetical protein